MRAKRLFLGIIIGAVLAAGFSWVLAQRHSSPRSRLFVTDGGETINGPLPAFNRGNDIRQSCPEAVFALEEDKSDYSLTMRWDQNHWGGLLVEDGAFLFQENGPDFNKIVRDACKAIQEDQRWPVGSQKQKAILLDRYELRDLHNGSLSTSAILDKQTGKVWVWTNLTRDDGKLTGKSAFISEEVSPPPE